MPKQLFYLHADCAITRRKRYHLLADKDGNTVFRAKLLTTILEWLRDNDAEAAAIIAEDSPTGWSLIRPTVNKRS